MLRAPNKINMTDKFKSEIFQVYNTSRCMSEWHCKKAQGKPNIRILPQQEIGAKTLNQLFGRSEKISIQHQFDTRVTNTPMMEATAMAADEDEGNILSTYVQGIFSCSF